MNSLDVIDGTTYSYCETLAALGAWHIRMLSSAGRKPTGGADTHTLCGLVAAWDVPSVERPFVFRPHVPGGWPPGNTCKLCSDLYRKTVQVP